jgi:hypothetical protein
MFLALCSSVLLPSFYRFRLTLFNTNFLQLLDLLWRSWLLLIWSRTFPDLYDQSINCRVQKIPKLVHILSPMNPIRNPTTYFLKFLFNIILSSRLRLGIRLWGSVKILYALFLFLPVTAGCNGMFSTSLQVSLFGTLKGSDTVWTLRALTLSEH